MDEYLKNKILPLCMAVFFGGMFLWCVGKTPDSYSISERRALAQAPDVTAPGILEGTFMTEFENYAMDQFPMRETFRSIKAFSEKAVFLKKDKGGLYYADGHLSKMDASLNESMLSHAAEVFTSIYDTYLEPEGIRPYFAIIPDKNYYLAGKNGYPCMDYPKLFSYMQEKCPYMQYIDITPLLSIDDYYCTDTHWRQECVVDVAEYLVQEMGNPAKFSYEKKTLENPFYGVYYGQAALPVSPDTLNYLTNDVIEHTQVTILEYTTEKESVVYNMDKAYDKDPYEMFLSGAMPLVTLRNDASDSSRRLIVFRDSFGSSLAPLLVGAYEEIVLVDIRYVQSAALSQLVDFSDADVLFLYSTLLLNSSLALK